MFNVPLNYCLTSTQQFSFSREVKNSFLAWNPILSPYEQICLISSHATSVFMLMMILICLFVCCLTVFVRGIIVILQGGFKYNLMKYHFCHTFIVFSLHLIFSLLEVRALGLPDVLRLWLVVSKGILSIKSFWPNKVWDCQMS